MKGIITSLEEVPEPLRGEYESKDGKFELKLEGPIPGQVPATQLAEANGKVVEFRDRNVSLLKDVAKLAGVGEASDLSPLKAKLDTFNGFDPEKYKAMETKIAEFEKKGIKGTEDIQALIKTAVEAGVAPLRAELVSEKQERSEAQKRADASLFGQTIGDKYLAVGGIASAKDFIVAEARKAFRVVGDAVVANADRFSAVKHGEPLEVDEWLTQVTKTFGFAFEQSSGGGAGGSGGGGGSPLKPGVREIRSDSLTPQQIGQLSKEISEGKVRIIE